MASCSIPAKEEEIPNWLALPRDITRNILQRLSTIDILTSACEVCPTWGSICIEPVMCNTITMVNLRGLPFDHEDMEDIFCHAIRRSRGHLKNLNIESFCTDELLEYVADKASNLERIRLVSCRLISDEGFIEAVRKLPQLQEVDISFCNLSKYSLEFLGRSCPLLKYLKFVKTGIEYTEYGGNDEAIVIAKTMPGLRHLIMVKNDVSEKGLTAILDGCPLLECLEFDECFGLSCLDLSLWRRCVKQVKKVYIFNVTDEVDYYSDGYDDDEYSYDLFLMRLYKCNIPRR